MKNIELNYKRLCDDEYSIENVFKKDDYDWAGDWEGRALLAFNCHYEMRGEKTPCLKKFFSEIDKHVNKDGYFGREYDGITVDEQQLSGNSWYLRGLVGYYKNFNDEKALNLAVSTAKNLYFPVVDKLKDYPLDRADGGGVSGNVAGEKNGWKISTDLGCLFMCVDGLSHLYRVWRDEKLLSTLESLINFFLTIDKTERKFQTHASLSCARGILELYLITGDEKYLEIAVKEFDYYVKNGMTYTYENFNWYGRKDTWTEPCAVTDSFILATTLYRVTGEEKYLRLSRRIWFNGLQFCQRENGGAGPNSCVYEENPVLKISLYEAPFCCTMRYAEALLVYSKNKKLFRYNVFKKKTTDDKGRTFKDDKLVIKIDGRQKTIFSCNTIKKEDAEKLRLKIF